MGKSRLPNDLGKAAKSSGSSQHCLWATASVPLPEKPFSHLLQLSLALSTQQTICFIDPSWPVWLTNPSPSSPPNWHPWKYYHLLCWSDTFMFFLKSINTEDWSLSWLFFVPPIEPIPFPSLSGFHCCFPLHVGLSQPLPPHPPNTQAISIAISHNTTQRRWGGVHPLYKLLRDSISM